jgi:hypothetical protein
MPKPHTFPILYDDLKTISIKFLTKHGYLKPNQWQNGTLNWSRNGNPTGSISIKVCTMPEYPFIELEYKYNENPMNYKIQLVCAPSNLGKGVVWFFVCSLTGKRCRKLYLANSFFYCRSAFNGCMYEAQTQSKKYRQLDKAIGAYLKIDMLYKELNKKNFKRIYAGKPTKRYLRIMEKIQKLVKVSVHDLEKVFLN